MKRLIPLLALCFCLPAPLQVAAAEPQPTAMKSPSLRWEKEIAAMEAADKTNPPAKGGVLFIGSSTIRMWSSLAKDFPQHKVINRGFGGSEIVDSTFFAPRLIFPLEPQVIFLRSGGNDIHNGKSPQQVFADYLAFVATVHAKLPKTQIIYLGLCPTIARIKEIPQGNQLNGLIQAYAATNPLLKIVDCADMTLGPDGQPRAELFLPDKLHLSKAGYELLVARTRAFMPAVEKK
jgi:lysophospholipase L1-like esterase